MKSAFETVVGLEVHCELSTETKIICGCKNAFGAPPNSLCCPVCTGMPGALPVLNRQVVHHAVLMGLALGCTINWHSQMDRKHYFYPDLPKAYQITQQARPLCENGRLEYRVDGQVRTARIARLHIEEDAGKLLHAGPEGDTLADYNRCGVPLIEIVTQPDMRSADEAKAVMEEIARIARYLGISQVKMQEGGMRADVNVSLREAGQAAYGKRTEMKNINSFMAVHRAVLYEEARQRELLQKGEPPRQETRRWDDENGTSHRMRTKEEAQDYRFFAEPDLPAVIITPEEVEALRKSLPELPLQKQMRFVRQYALPAYDAELLCENVQLAAFFEETTGLGAAPKAVANWLLGDVRRLLKENGKSLEEALLTPGRLAGLLALVAAGDISGTAAKTVLAQMMETGHAPEEIAQRLGLMLKNDEAWLQALVADVLHANPKAVSDYRAGKTKVLGFLVGQCMRQSRGQAAPEHIEAQLLHTLAQMA